MTKLHELFPVVNANILDFLIDEFKQNPHKDFDRYMIARGADVTTRSLIRYLPMLIKEEIIIITRKGGVNQKLMFYKLSDNPRTKSLVRFWEVSA